jgi:hypothetical protein
MLSSGCEDLPLCRSEVSVAFDQTVISVDLDAVAPGVQTQIRVRTSLRELEMVTLEVEDADGATLGTYTRRVASDGSALFSDIAVSAPRVTLHATARGTCGEGDDEITVEVTAGAGCEVRIEPAPETSEHFAPLGVLSTHSDPDPVTPGYQATVRVVMREGWTAELLERRSREDQDDQREREALESSAEERSLGTLAAGGDGTASMPVTLRDGEVGFRATCQGPTSSAASPLIRAVVDTTPPTCEIVAPVPGAVITPALDANLDLGDGIQLRMVGHAGGGDVAGEAALMTIAPSGGSQGSEQIAVPASDADDAGMTVASATLETAAAPASYHFALTMRDHAGNTCTSLASHWVVFEAVPPAVVGDFAAVAVDRQRIRLLWTAPGSATQPVAAYALRSSPAPITEASFDAAAALVTAAPRLPGGAEALDVFPARTGAARYFALAAIDPTGRRGAISTVGPIVPAFDRTGAIAPANPAQGALGLGAAIAHGKFNDDDFEDVAVAAPFQNAGPRDGAGAVYIYFGGPGGISSTPSLTITSAETAANLGAGLAALRWTSKTRDDLAIGAPGAGGGAGRIFVLSGGATLGTGTRAATAAERTISVSATQPGWFAGGGLGSALVAADVDGDGTIDLVASAPRGGGRGGAVIVHGGTVRGNVVLSDQNAGAANGAVVERFADPGSAPGRRLGFYLHGAGKTQGASDTTDDVVIAYADNYATAGDSLYVLRGSGARPPSAGVTERPFAPGRDVRLDLVTASRVTEWGSAVATLEDQNGDGARELVIGAYRAQGDSGQVLIVSGNALGSGGVARTTDAGVTLATITAAAGVGRVGAAIAARGAPGADIDGDGREDLFIAARSGASGAAFVWFGGAIPRGAVTTATAQLAMSAPRTFTFVRQRPQGVAGQAQWIGDINGDGLDDLCWASPFDNNRDGGFEVLWDAR